MTEELKLGTDIASIIVKYMLEKGYEVFSNPGECNIVYLEGVSMDFTLNQDVPNHFNDVRLVIEFEEGKPKVVGKWQATTEPGSRYTVAPMNPKGAARIKFGQYQAWKVGVHGNSEPHDALVQTGGSVTVHRDFNKDFKRTNDKLDTGWFGINQHHGYDHAENNVGAASAGCLVGRSRKGHFEFMAIVKQDKRYLSDKNFVFTSTIIAGDDLLR